MKASFKLIFSPSLFFETYIVGIFLVSPLQIFQITACWITFIRSFSDCSMLFPFILYVLKICLFISAASSKSSFESSSIVLHKLFKTQNNSFKFSSEFGKNFLYCIFIESYCFRSKIWLYALVSWKLWEIFKKLFSALLCIYPFAFCVLFWIFPWAVDWALPKLLISGNNV